MQAGTIVLAICVGQTIVFRGLPLQTGQAGPSAGSAFAAVADHRSSIAFQARVALAEDWPQFLGPARNGTYSGNDLAAKWAASGPAVVWKKDVGQGFSSPVVAQGRLILFHRAGDKEVVEALDAANGKPIWSFDYPTHYR